MLTFDRQKVLGKGGFATVYEGIWGETKVTVKRFLIGDAASNEQEEKALKMLDHTNVIKLFHVEEDQDFKSFALELCDASLEKLFLKESDLKKYRGPMPPDTEVLLQLAKGLEYIHQMGLVHRDIKPQNVLISLNFATRQVVMKWADFGFSKRVNERGSFSMSGVRGTYDYFAPEILKLLDEPSSDENEAQNRGTVKSDVFAEGLVFGYFISGGVHPFGKTSHQISVNVRTNELVNLPKTDKIRNTIIEMLEKEQNNRISSSDVVNRLTNIILKNSQQMLTLLAEGNPSVEEIGKLIQEGVDINVKDPNGSTPLLHVAENKIGSDKVVEIVGLLIQNGANVNSLNCEGENALLIMIDINCQDKNGSNALTKLSEFYQNENLIEIIQLLIQNGIDVNNKINVRWNALTLLCRHYQNTNLIKIIQLLIQTGIDVNCKTNGSWNALTLLCRHYKNENLIEIIRLLIQHGIDVNCKTDYGSNALTILCHYYQNGNAIEIIQLLIQHGIDVNCKTDYEANALTILCHCYQNENLIDIIRLLVENGIDVNRKTNVGWNALNFLCCFYQKENLIEIIQLLIETGIEVSCTEGQYENNVALLRENYKNENLIDIIGLLNKNGIGFNSKECCEDRGDQSRMASLLHVLFEARKRFNNYFF
ncbi:probable serine/threonine-protein kinase irlC isoform X2 [Daphnia pulex]|uniref:probable serine/threonine-protein kinase irlC isoform X2 n=1 Tax=Daphnia pulex TaxID=6669 RepID=UPI001EDE6B60|nr:probable serine/threonine-protein kinase irlC isoform X2 [Daphnia pulex]